LLKLIGHDYARGMEYRQPQHEGGAAADGLRRKLKRSGMALGNGARDREPEPKAETVARAAHERLEQRGR
jgi:hypothetical protein